MTVEPERGVGELQRAEEDERSFRRRVRRRFQLADLHFMPTPGGLGSAERVSERFGPSQPRTSQADAEGRAALSVQLGSGMSRETGTQPAKIGEDVPHLSFADDVLKDVEAILRVGGSNFRGEPAFGGEKDRSPIGNRLGARKPVIHVLPNGLALVAVVGRTGLDGALAVDWVHERAFRI